MPYNRRRKRRRNQEQIAFRLGKYNSSGKRPVKAFSKMVWSRCSNHFNTWRIAATADEGTAWGSFDLTNWSNPATFTGGSFHQDSTMDKHPDEHANVIALGFSKSRVLSSMYRFDLRFVGTDNARKDWVFAYKFGIASTVPFTIGLTSGNLTRDNWSDIRSSRGWIWRRFSGTGSGGSIYPSAGIIEVRTGNLMKLAKALLNPGVAAGTVLEVPDFQASINDSGSNDAAAQIFLHVAIINCDGTAFDEDDGTTFDISDHEIDLDIFQTVLVTTSMAQANMVEEVDEVGA